MSRIILLLGDVHANLPALEAVLNDAGKYHFQQIWNTGDFVGYYPFPNEVTNLLRRWNAVSIAGNYDLKVLSFEENKQKWILKKAPEKYLSFKWTYEKLSIENRKYLTSLPEQICFEIDGLKILMTHGSPASNEEYICKETTQQRLKELAELAKADIIISGHSHLVFSKKIGKTLFLNPGSVGRPEGSEGKATYSILKFTEKSVDFDNYEVEYNMKKTIQAIRKAKLPEDFIRMLQQGKNLIQLKTDSNNPSQKQHAEQIDCVTAFAESFDYEQEHSQQVKKNALLLFDELQAIHGFSEQERFYLHCGAILHDIGWIKGQKGHHKAACDMIIKSINLPFDLHQRTIIGLIARYHRKALPKLTHKYFRKLSPDDQHTVSMLAGILRIADGLDRSHMSYIIDIKCKMTDREICIILYAKTPVLSEMQAATKKSDLIQHLAGKEVVFKIPE
jgi:putative phosphoesterase